MLINFSNYLKKTNALQRDYRGIVVNNIDPLKIGRIQVNLPNFIEGTQSANGSWNLPWVYQKSPSMLGGSGNSSSFAVPEIGNEVFVEFKGDVYAMFYSYYWQSSTTHQADFDEDYPASYGFRDVTGNLFKINKAKQFMQFIHSSGLQWLVDSLSNGTLTSNNTLNFLAQDGKTQFTMDMVNGNITLNARNSITLNAPTLNQNISTVTGNQGNHNDTVGGYRNSQIYGSYIRSIGGDDGESILGNRSSTVVLDDTELIGGNSDSTYGTGRSETVVEGNYNTSLEAGNRDVTILLGNYKVSLTSGSITIENAISTLSMDITGDIELSNATSELSISSVGDVKLENETSSLELSVSGDIKLKNAVGDIDISPAGIITLNSSTFSPGNVLTTTSDPVVDLITGVPTVGVPGVFAQ
jgi:hypothetical protein